MVKKIKATNKIDCEHLLGKFLDESNYDILIESDVDFYSVPDINGESEILFSFRKDYFTEEEQLGAYEGLKAAATVTENRGVAAGTKEGHINSFQEGERQFVTNYETELMDAISDSCKGTLDEREDCIDVVRRKYSTVESRRKCEGAAMNNTWVINRIVGGKKLFNFDEWIDSLIHLSNEERLKEVEIISSRISSTHYGVKVNSGVAGYFGRYPRIPYGRKTAYTEFNSEKWKSSFPFLQKLSSCFKEILPKKWQAQNECVQKLDPEFVIPGTVFTTVTVNKTFRTAAHRDAGDLPVGFSNLCVITNGKKFSGGYLILPEYRAAINIRPGDMLLVNNHECIHGNTPIVLEEEGAERISLVCYFRENMQELGEKKYEDARYNFVVERRNNKEHPLWNSGWNGISPGMWSDKEWHDFLLTQENGERYLMMYHPEAKKASLEDMFA